MCRYSLGLLFVGFLVLNNPVESRAQDIRSALDNASREGETLQKKGDFQGALERFRWCTATAREKGDEFKLSVCLQLIGGVQRLLGEYVDAEAHYRDALAHAVNIQDFERETYILNNLANLFGAQGRYSETIAMLRRCLEIDELHGIQDDAAPHQNLAIAYSLRGDHARSLEEFLSALRIYERLNAAGKVALVHYNMGVLQMNQGNYPAAKRELLIARELAQKSGDQNIVAQSVGDLGRVQELEGHSTEALASLEQALALCRKSGYKSCIGESEMNLGNFHVSHLNQPLAAAAFGRAREIFEALNDPYNLGQTLRGLGYVARLRLDYGAARDYALQAIELSRKIGDPDGEWQGQALLGLIALDSGDRGAARTAWQAAIDGIERQRGKVGGGEAERQRFFEKAVYPYQQLALLEAEAHRPLAALRAAESARARVLRDMLAASPEKIADAATDSERSEETKLLATMAGLNAAMARAVPEGKSLLRTRYEEAWGRYEAFRAALYVRRPALRASRGESPVLNEAELGALLPDDQSALLEFSCLKDRTLLFVVSRSSDPARPGVAVFSIPSSRSDLAKRAERFRALLEQRDPGFRTEARSLFRLLFGPASAALRGKTNLRLVADGPLWELPFQALVDGTGRYWVENVTLASSPSFTFLRDRARLPNAPRGSLDLLALGDPAAAGGPSIPLLRSQVARIAALYDAARTATRTGDRADEATFRVLAPQARVIHLAT
ncbi:MAG: tetratricopeptide repeat protein, partial [Acidobacteriota bacterium]